MSGRLIRILRQPRWLSFGFGVILALTPSATSAHGGHEHIKKKRVLLPKEAYAPSLIPDRIILTWADDPKTTQAVTWRTSTEVTNPCAEIAEATAGPEFRSLARAIPATSQRLATDINEALFHSVQFRNLKPATTYCYRVGDGANWSEWFQFTTDSHRPEPFSFIYFGDAQNDVRSLWSRVVRQAQRDAPKAKFFVHAGDLINKAESDAEWGEWFSAGGWLNAMIPSMPVPGNHEQAKLEDDSRRLSHHWRPQFTLPHHGPAGLEETCYAFEYQNTLMVSLNSNERLEEQAVWLEQRLAQNRQPWVVAVFHHPIFSAAKERDNEPLRNAWKPIFDRYHVDLVLQGHDHSYARSGTSLEPSLQTEGNHPSGVNHVDPTVGTVFVVSVSGPKMYPSKPQAKMERIGEDLQLYQVIHIDGDTLRYEARTAIGDLYDAFSLKKQVNGLNQLIEQVPPTPERRRPPVDTVPPAVTVPPAATVPPAVTVPPAATTPPAK